MVRLPLSHTVREMECRGVVAACTIDAEDVDPQHTTHRAHSEAGSSDDEAAAASGEVGGGLPRANNARNKLWRAKRKAKKKRRQQLPALKRHQAVFSAAACGTAAAPFVERAAAADLGGVAEVERQARLQAEGRNMALVLQHVEDVRQRQLLLLRPPSITPPADGYHVVQMPSGVWLLVPELIGEKGAFDIYELAMQRHRHGVKTVRAIPCVPSLLCSNSHAHAPPHREHDSHWASPGDPTGWAWVPAECSLCRSVCAPALLSRCSPPVVHGTPQMDVHEIDRKVALHHTDEDIDGLFSTYGVYMMPFLASGWARPHMDDAGARLLGLEETNAFDAARDGVQVMLRSHICPPLPSRSAGIPLSFRRDSTCPILAYYFCIRVPAHRYKLESGGQKALVTWIASR